MFQQDVPYLHFTTDQNVHLNLIGDDALLGTTTDWIHQEDTWSWVNNYDVRRYSFKEWLANDPIRSGIVHPATNNPPSDGESADSDDDSSPNHFFISMDAKIKYINHWLDKLSSWLDLRDVVQMEEYIQSDFGIPTYLQLIQLTMQMWQGKRVKINDITMRILLSPRGTYTINKRIYCPFCLSSELSTTTLVAHFRRNHWLNPKSCICGFPTPDALDARKHLPNCRLIPQSSTTYDCYSILSKYFISNNTLHKHRRVSNLYKKCSYVLDHKRCIWINRRFGQLSPPMVNTLCLFTYCNAGNIVWSKVLTTLSNRALSFINNSYLPWNNINYHQVHYGPSWSESLCSTLPPHDHRERCWMVSTSETDCTGGRSEI